MVELIKKKLNKRKHLMTCDYKDSDIKSCPYCKEDIKFDTLGIQEKSKKTSKKLKKYDVETFEREYNRLTQQMQQPRYTVPRVRQERVQQPRPSDEVWHVGNNYYQSPVLTED